jgi:hypothetical protein
MVEGFGLSSLRTVIAIGRTNFRGQFGEWWKDLDCIVFSVRDKDCSVRVDSDAVGTIQRLDTVCRELANEFAFIENLDPVVARVGDVQ